MAGYGRDFGAGYPGDAGRGRYDDFRFGPRGGPPRGGRGGPDRWSAFAPGWGGEPGPPPRGYGRDFGYGPGAGHGGWGPGPGGGRARRRDPAGARKGESAADWIRAADIMTANPEAVTPDTPLSEVASRMRELDVGIIPVVDDLDAFRLRGVITDRDIAVRAVSEGKDGKKAKVSAFMTSEVKTVHENDHVRDVFTVMKRERVRRVPVVDGEGKLLGIIAQADLAVGYAGLDLQRETEVEEVIERISEPAAPRWGGREGAAAPRRRYVAGGPVYDDPYRGAELGDRLREGWDRLRREARHLMRRGYDRGW